MNFIIIVGLGEYYIVLQLSYIISAQFLNVYENRILDIYLKECNTLMENSSKCFFYII